MFEYEYDNTVATKPVSTRPVAEKVLLGEGPAYFVVEKATAAESKAGNSQLVVVLKATDENGRTALIWEYFPALKQCAHKLKGFLHGVGRPDLYAPSGTAPDGGYKTGGFDESQLIGLSGSCMIKHETTPDYGTQAKVKFYFEKNEKFVPHHVQQAVKQTQNETIEDDSWKDEIPF